eukprot:6183823-Pleurochrysis_carterae.AAC.2
MGRGGEWGGGAFAVGETAASWRKTPVGVAMADVASSRDAGETSCTGACGTHLDGGTLHMRTLFAPRGTCALSFPPNSQTDACRTSSRGALGGSFSVVDMAETELRSLLPVRRMSREKKT